jgi:hypothetical protein
VLRIRNIGDVLLGAFIILTAIVALWLVWNLSSSAAVGLGPGYIPKLLAVILIGLGLAVALQGFLSPGEKEAPWQLRPLALILASIAFFALTIERLGLVVALTGLVLIGCAANRDTKITEALALALGTVVFSVLVFVHGLGQTMLVWPPIWGGN